MLRKQKPKPQGTTLQELKQKKEKSIILKNNPIVNAKEEKEKGGKK